jgi:hypothetical protein
MIAAAIGRFAADEDEVNKHCAIHHQSPSATISAINGAFNVRPRYPSSDVLADTGELQELSLSWASAPSSKQSEHQLRVKPSFDNLSTASHSGKNGLGV